MKASLRLLCLLGGVCLLNGCTWFEQDKRPNDHWLDNTQPSYVYQNSDGSYTSSSPIREPSNSKPVYYHSGSSGGEYQSRSGDVPSTTAVSKRHKSERNAMKQQINQTLGK